MIEQKYCAVRFNSHDKKEWLDYDTLAATIELVRNRVEFDKSRFEEFDKAHPVVRISQIEIREIGP